MNSLLALLFDAYDLYNDMEISRTGDAASKLLSAWTNVIGREQKAEKVLPFVSAATTKKESVLADEILRYDPISFAVKPPIDYHEHKFDEIINGKYNDDSHKINLVFDILKVCALHTLGLISADQAKQSLDQKKIAFYKLFTTTENSLKHKIFFIKVANHLDSSSPENVKVATDEMVSESQRNQLLGDELFKAQKTIQKLMEQIDYYQKLDIESLKKEFTSLDEQYKEVKFFNELEKTKVIALKNEYGEYAKANNAMQVENERLKASYATLVKAIQDGRALLLKMQIEYSEKTNVSSPSITK